MERIRKQRRGDPTARCLGERRKSSCRDCCTDYSPAPSRDTAGPGGRGLGEGWDMTRLARGRHLAPGTDPAQVHCVVHSPRTCGGHGECGGLW